jgi:hypothetical protein
VELRDNRQGCARVPLSDWSGGGVANSLTGLMDRWAGEIPATDNVERSGNRPVEQAPVVDAVTSCKGLKAATNLCG